MKEKQTKNNIIPSHNKKQQSIENLIALENLLIRSTQNSKNIQSAIQKRDTRTFSLDLSHLLQNRIGSKYKKLQSKFPINNESVSLNRLPANPGAFENKNFKSNSVDYLQDHNFNNTNGNLDLNFQTSPLGLGLLTTKNSNFSKFSKNSLNKNLFNHFNKKNAQHHSNSSGMYNLTELNQSCSPETYPIPAYLSNTDSHPLNLNHIQNQTKKVLNNSGNININVNVSNSNSIGKYLKGVCPNTSFNFIPNGKKNTLIKKEKNESRNLGNLSKINYLSNSFLYSLTNVNKVNNNSFQSKNVTNENILADGQNAKSGNIDSKMNFKSITENNNKDNIKYNLRSISGNLYNSCNFKNKKNDTEKIFVKKTFGGSNSNLKNLMNSYNDKKFNSLKSSKLSQAEEKFLNDKKIQCFNSSQNLNQIKNLKQNQNNTANKVYPEINRDIPANISSKNVCTNTFNDKIISISNEDKTPTTQAYDYEHKELRLNEELQTEENYQTFLTNDKIPTEANLNLLSPSQSQLEPETKIKLKKIKNSLQDLLYTDSNSNKIHIIKELESIYKEVITKCNLGFNENFYSSYSENIYTQTEERNTSTDDRKEIIKLNELTAEILAKENECVMLKNKNELTDKKLELAEEENSKLRNYLKEKSDNMEDMKNILNHYKKEIEDLKRNQNEITKINKDREDRNLSKQNSKVSRTPTFKPSSNSTSYDQSENPKLLSPIFPSNRVSKFSSVSINESDRDKIKKQTENIFYLDNENINGDKLDGSDAEILESLAISLDDQKILHYSKVTNNDEKLYDTAIMFPQKMNIEPDKNSIYGVTLEQKEEDTDSSKIRLITKNNNLNKKKDGDEESSYVTSSDDEDMSSKVKRIDTGCFMNGKNNIKNEAEYKINENKISTGTTLKIENFHPVLNLEKIKQNNFQDEFLEHFEEFSISWRKEVEKMNRSNFPFKFFRANK